MPYRHAHWYILALFPLAAFAFWPSYISQLANAPAEFHAHGITASLWLLLLAAQSWTIQHDSRAVHRTVGMSSLLLFPLFLMGGSGIFFGMAHRFAEGSPFHVMYAPKLAWLDVVGVAGMAYFYYEALRQRRKVHAHSGFMLATAIFLLPPIFGRLSAIPLGVRGPQDFAKLELGFQLANVLTAAVAFIIAFRRGRNGWPFGLAGVLTLVGAFLFQTIGGLASWRALYGYSAELPVLPFQLLAGAAGVGIAYAGWVAGRRTVGSAAVRV